MSLQDELIKFSVDIEMNEADQKAFSDKIKEAETACASLRKEIKLDEQALAILAAKGEKGSQAFQELSNKIENNKEKLKENRETAELFSKVLDKNSMSADQLRKYSNQLRNELNSMSKSLNPKQWNELNKEYISTRKRLEEVSVGTKNTQKCCVNLFNSVTSFAKGNVWTLIAGAATKALKTLGEDFIRHSQTWSDKWDHFTSGVKTAYQSMLTTITTGDWSNFFENIKQGYEEGKRLAAVLDELFELNNSLELLEVKNESAIAEQKAIMRDSSKTSAQRIAAANEVLRLENEIRVAKQKTAEVELSAAKDALKLQTKMTDNQMEEFIDNYLENRDLYKKAEDFMAQEEALRQRKKEREDARADKKVSNEDFKAIDNSVYALEQQQKALYESDRALAAAVDAMNRYNLGNDELVKNYVTARKKMLMADAEYNQGTVRSRAFLSSESYKAEKEDAEKASRETLNVLKEQYASGAMTKEQYSARMTEATQEMYRKQMAIAVKYGQDTTELESKIYDAAIARREELAKASADGYKVWLKELQKDIDSTMKEMQKDYEAQIKSLEESVNSEDQAEFTAKLKAASDIQKDYGGKEEQLAAAEVDFDNEMRQLDELHEMKFISEEAYERRKLDMVREYTKKVIDIQMKGWKKGFQTASVYLNQADALVSSIQEAEMASLDAKMEAELRAAGDNADERAAIEERYEAQKLEIQKKYADIDMGVKIAQAIASGALAMVQAWNAAGGQPIAFAVIAALIAATTAANVATIVAQRNAIMNSSASTSSSSSSQRVVTGTGYSEGGYTGDGGRLEPAGIVHRGEYVVPQPEMRDPAVIARVREIEAIRTQRISSNRLPGFAEGGYTGNISSVGQDNIRQLTKAIQEMNRKPMKAYVVLSDLQAQENLTAKMKKAASR